MTTEDRDVKLARLILTGRACDCEECVKATAQVIARTMRGERKAAEAVWKAHTPDGLCNCKPCQEYEASLL